MKKASTYFLRFAIFVIGLMVLALCVFALPAAWPGAVAEFPYAVLSIRLIIIGLYLATVPFYVALWQALKLLRLIDENKAFAEVSVAALRTIKRCATLITGIFVVFVPLLFPIAEVDDAPGLVVVGAVIAGAPAVVAVFAALLQKLLQNAIDIKSENDLTV